jgi:hypothetical protein
VQLCRAHDAGGCRTTFALANEIALSSQDATIYATILHHLRTAGDEPKVFATQNTSDFLSPTIEQELARYNCKLFGSFRNSEGYIREDSRSFMM